MPERFPGHDLFAEPLSVALSVQVRGNRAQPETHADYLLQVTV